MKLRWSAIGLALVVWSAACSTSSSTSKTTTSSASTTTAAPSSVATTAPSSSSTSAAPSSAATTAPAAPANPFTGVDTFCKTAPAATGLKATTNGVTADTITVVHVRQQLEKLEGIGFAVPVGDPDDIVKTFFGEINKCGGINGRKVEVKTVEYSPLDTSVDKVCVAATEDTKTFGVISGTGWGGPSVGCVAVDHKAVIVSSTGVPRSLYESAGGRIVTADIAQEDGLKFMVDALISQKKLDGKKIGVVASSYNGTDKTVQTGLVDYLKSKGLNVVKFEVIDCTAALCNQGHQQAVENLKNAGVDALFPTMNLVTLPYFVKEAAVQGFKPSWYQSNFNSMGGDLANSKVFDFGGDEAAKLYGGATLIDWPLTGTYRTPTFKTDPFNEMCNATYAKSTTTGAKYDAKTDSTKYGMVATMCSNIRIFARAAFDAGADLTPDSWAAAAGKLGKVDLNGGAPGTITGNKRFAPVEVRFGVVTYPCPDPAYKLCVQLTDDPPFKVA